MELFAKLRDLFSVTRVALADGKLTKDECLAIARAAIDLVTALLGPVEAQKLVASMLPAADDKVA
jgi:hypothetical protein